MNTQEHVINKMNKVMIINVSVHCSYSKMACNMATLACCVKSIELVSKCAKQEKYLS